MHCFNSYQSINSYQSTYIEMVKTFIKMPWMQVWWFYFHWAGKLQTFGTPVPSYGASPELTFKIWSVQFVQFVQPFFSIHDTNLSNSTWGQYPGAFVACHPANAKAQHAGACNCFALKENEPSELKSSQPMMNCAKLMKRGLNFKTHDGHQSTWISAKSSTLLSGHATFQSFPSKATWDHRSQWQAPGRKFKIKDSSFRQMFVKQQNGMKYYERQECFHFLTTRLVRCT